MNMKILLPAFGVVLLTSCTTAYKSGQTPDDVYYSPAREQEAYVNVEERQDRTYNRRQSNQSYSNGNNSDYYNYRDDRFLRLSIANRYRWNNYNDYFMFDNVYNRYDYNIFNPWNTFSPWNNYYYWNNFYNPYTRYALTNPVFYHPGYIGGTTYTPQSPQVISRPRSFSPNSYTNRNFNNSNLSMDRNLGNSNTSGKRGSGIYNNSNNNNNSRYNNSRYNNANRSISADTYNNYNNQSRNNSNSYSQPSRSADAPVRTYNPSSSGSSSSGSSGSSGGGGARPTRGGN